MKISDNGKGNRIAVAESPNLSGSIVVHGDGSAVDVSVRSGNVEIVVEGDGGSVFIDQVPRAGRLRVVVKNGGSVSIGRDTTLEECYILADGASITIGQDCMISFQVSIRTTDAHGIYDLTTGDLLNGNEDVVIEDHVWLAQAALIAKGTHIGRDVVVGAKSYLSKARIPANCIVAGTPPRVLRENIIWDRRMTTNIYADEANCDPNFSSHLDKAVSQRVESP